MDWLAEESDDLIANKKKNWKILIVDDDLEVHKVTKLALQSFTFENKGAEFISAYSGEEAKKVLSSTDDIGLVLLDVVMESDHSGLNIVKYIREVLDNHYTRVVIRTGQPGFAPIHDVICNYDIDGYLTKTEITHQVLQHTIFIALRSYRDLVRLQKYQKGLEAIINSIANLSQIDEVLELAKAVVMQLSGVLSADDIELHLSGVDLFTLTKSSDSTLKITIDEHQVKILTKDNQEESDAEYLQLSEQAISQKKNIHQAPYYINYYQSKRGTETVFIIKSEQALNKKNEWLLSAFSVQVALTIENLLLMQKVNN